MSCNTIAGCIKRKECVDFALKIKEHSHCLVAPPPPHNPSGDPEGGAPCGLKGPLGRAKGALLRDDAFIRLYFGGECQEGDQLLGYAAERTAGGYPQD